MKTQTLRFGIAVFAIVIAVASISAACTNATVVGVWGYEVGASVGQFTADGLGNLTGSQTTSQHGVVQTQTYTGTYSVAANCRGSMTLQLTGGGTETVNFILDNGKKGAQVISTDSGSVASGIASAEGTVTCGLTGIKHTFATNLLGTITTTGPIAYVVQLVLNGSGGVSGGGTFDVNGTITSHTVTGTYTENANCTGTMQITPNGLGTMNFNFVVVNAGKEDLLIETDANTVVIGNMQQ
jgi:hypothetical protein